MAFIELTKDEIAILSEAEKKQYNKKLLLYRERVAFVEKLEQIESADFQYQKPKLKRIKPVQRLEIPKYKEVSIVSVALPKDTAKLRNFGDNTNVQLSLNNRIRTGISVRYKATAPTFKVAVPMEDIAYNGKKKYELSNVLESKRKIDAPTMKIKAISKSVITNLPSKKKTSIPNVFFKFKSKPIKVSSVKVRLPKTTEFTGIDVIKIKNISTVSINKTTKKTYSYTQKNSNVILDVSSKDIYAKINFPQVMFKPQTVKIQGVVKPKVHETDISEIDRRVKKCKIEKVNPKKCMATILTLPVSKKYAVQAYKVTMTSIKKVSVPVLKEYKTPIVNTEIEKLIQSLNVYSVSEIGQYKLPIITSVSGVNPPTVHLPHYSAINIGHSEIADIPTLSINIPDYTEDDVNSVLNRIIKEIQGA